MEAPQLFLLVHLIGIVFGVGGATANDFLFFKFLKDLRISKFEAGVLKTLSTVIWTGLILLIVSGIGLYLPEMERLNQTPKFLAKIIVVAVILINGIALNLFISPRLRKISFEGRHDHVSGELRKLRKLAFALGAISITSWYSALMLGFLHNVQYGLLTIISAYAAALLAVIMVSQLAEYLISKRKRLI